MHLLGSFFNGKFLVRTPDKGGVRFAKNSARGGNVCLNKIRNLSDCVSHITRYRSACSHRIQRESIADNAFYKVSKQRFNRKVLGCVFQIEQGQNVRRSRYDYEVNFQQGDD
jgi:hypothetical protein